jgi:hypothetical protein
MNRADTNGIVRGSNHVTRPERRMVDTQAVGSPHRYSTRHYAMTAWTRGNLGCERDVDAGKMGRQRSAVGAPFLKGLAARTVRFNERLSALRRCSCGQVM